MARINHSVSASSPSVDSSIYRDRTPDGQQSAPAARQRAARATTVYSAVSSPTDASSDKENRPNNHPARMDKGKAPMRPPSMPTPTSDGNENEIPRASKKRKLHDRDTSVTTNGEPIADLQYYDPDQDPEERRQLRRDMRDLTRDFNDRREQLMDGDNSELIGFIEKSNTLYNRVKQTADATIDSRFLVNASDLTLKKTTAMVMGENSTGIDVDEFVTKCIAFMQNNGYDDDEAAPTQAASTQARARKQARRNNLDSDDEQEDTGDAHAWDILGERACFNMLTRRMEAVDEELGEYPGEPSEEVIEETMEKHGITHDGEEEPAMSLFEFAINPQSFGQTVENLFYTSFLIREGSVRIEKDRHGLPIICPTESRGLNEQRAQNVSRHQAVFSIDYPMWQKFIEAFNIREPVIAHRNDEQPTQSVRGWYG
ncbi:putative nuclear protein qri2 protein [Neofusicoccum parvum UCRNP2]|uniref:Non-structural maintenance of chromosomes element 4 n=1 Tax=Botryosphaeria parva (strain UCR-NP2) TaxID=1287680 RepID=R1G5Y7_BOTPV|nr:putative nuclear protein qri2 protein [Neofusicoccum parvum UCRNP2]